MNNVTTGDPNYTEHGATQTVALVTTRRVNGVTVVASPGALGGSPSNFYGTDAGAATAGGLPGTGPGIVAAVDNTLGSFSPYAGRLYIAYTGLAAVGAAGTDTNVFLVHSDTDGRTWNDTAASGNSPTLISTDNNAANNYSEGDRPMFDPAITVDPVTGTVVITYYDGSYDAGETRVANSVTYSVDGGANFSPPVTMNEEQTATDAITGDTIDVAPVGGNQALAGTFGFGDRTGLVAYDGDVVSLFGSNANTGGAAVWTADVSIPSGPTVVSSDMGPVTSDFTYTPTVYDPNNYNTVTNTYNGSTPAADGYTTITYNNVFWSGSESTYADGTRGLNGFVVTFDRPIDINSFNLPAEVQVQYESTTGATSQITVASITPLDLGTLFGPDQVSFNPVNQAYILATQFLITLAAPQYNIGTYSYAIGLDAGGLDAGGTLISDDIRTVSPTGIADVQSPGGFTRSGPSGTATVNGTSGVPILLGTYMNQNGSANTDVTQVQGHNTVNSNGTFVSADTPQTGTSVTSNITVANPYQQITQNFYDPIEVQADVALNFTEFLTATLISPDGTTVSFGPAVFTPGNDGIATVIFADFNPYNNPDVVTPATALGTQDPLAVLLKENPYTIGGSPWTLILTSTGGSTFTLNDWQLILPLTTNEYAVPNPDNGIPFQFPYSNQTLPLSIPGPHVVSTAVVSANDYLTVGNYSNTTPFTATAGGAASSILSIPTTQAVANPSQVPEPPNASQVQQNTSNPIEVGVDLYLSTSGEQVTLQLVAQDGTTVTLFNGTITGFSASYTFNDYAPFGSTKPVTPWPPWWAKTRRATGSLS